MRDTALADISDAGRYQKKVRFALQHPDCPITLTNHEIELLSKHLGVRLSRIWKRNADSQTDD